MIVQFADAGALRACELWTNETERAAMQRMDTAMALAVFNWISLLNTIGAALANIRLEIESNRASRTFMLHFSI
jgi:hypothetical protein